MIPRRSLRWPRYFLLSCLLPALSVAQVPSRLGYQGRLIKADGSTETGVVQLKLALFAAVSGGAELWNEQQTLAVADGFYATLLGEVSALPADLFDGRNLFLEVSVSGSPLAPRTQLTSVPYALAAGTARDVIGGKVRASSVWVGDKQVIGSDGKLGGGAEYAAGSGLELTGNAFSLLKSCSSGQLLKWNGTAWACAEDSAGMGGVAVAAPLTGTGAASSPISLAPAGAAADGYLAKGDWAAFNAKVGGTDARLSDARDPKPGSAAYVQNQGSADQDASLRLKGSATVLENLGAGTSAPTARLHVTGSSAVSGTGLVSANTGTSSLSGAGTKFLSEASAGDQVTTTGTCSGTGQTTMIIAVGADNALTVGDPWTTGPINCNFTLTKAVARIDRAGGQLAALIDGQGRLGVGTLQPRATLDVNGGARIRGFTFEHQGADFVLGSNSGRPAGTKTAQRALVHLSSPVDSLYLNFDGDFEGGVVVQGPGVTVAGDLTVSGKATVTGTVNAVEKLACQARWGSWNATNDTCAENLVATSNSFPYSSYPSGCPVGAQKSCSCFSIAASAPFLAAAGINRNATQMWCAAWETNATGSWAQSLRADWWGGSDTTMRCSAGHSPCIYIDAKNSGGTRSNIEIGCCPQSSSFPAWCCK